MRKIKNEELGRPTLDEYRKMNKLSLAVVLDDVRSLNNVGSVFRTCDAFLVERILLCGITGKPPHKDIYKTALGASESVKWQYYAKAVDGIKRLMDDGYKIISIEQVEGNMALQDFPVSKDEKYALVFGNEMKGVNQEVVNLCNHYIEIPQYGTKHSLNIAVSAGIVIWHFFNRMNPSFTILNTKDMR